MKLISDHFRILGSSLEVHIKSCPWFIKIIGSSDIAKIHPRLPFCFPSTYSLHSAACQETSPASDGASVHQHKAVAGVQLCWTSASIFAVSLRQKTSQPEPGRVPNQLPIPPTVAGVFHIYSLLQAKLTLNFYF